MPHKNTWEQEGLYRKFTGEVSGDEILESNFGLHTHPKFQAIKYIINDFTEVTGASMQTSSTKAFATSDDIISHSKGRLKIALVVTQDPFIALANSYREQMVGKLFECEIFKTIGDARKWVSDE